MVTAEALPPGAAAWREAVRCSGSHFFKQTRLENLVGVTASGEGLHALPEGQVVTDVAGRVLERALMVLTPGEKAQQCRECSVRTLQDACWARLTVNAQLCN